VRRVRCENVLQRVRQDREHLGDLGFAYAQLGHEAKYVRACRIDEQSARVASITYPLCHVRG
jgi:hypothetical protein